MFDIKKFFGGFAFWQGEKLGKIVFQVIIIVLCLWLFWAKFIHITPTTTNKQKATNITNITSVKEESAFELQLIPPSIKVGSLRLRLLGK